MPKYDKPLPLPNHPMQEHISTFYDCKERDCTDRNIIVEQGEYEVHPHSGDCYGNYVISCSKCKRRERKTFADN
jgi:hypothetical protein